MAVQTLGAQIVQHLRSAYTQTGRALKEAEGLQIVGKSGDVDAVHIANEQVAERMAAHLGETTPFYLAGESGASRDVREAQRLLDSADILRAGDTDSLRTRMGGAVRAARHATPYALGRAELPVARQHVLDGLRELRREIRAAYQRVEVRLPQA